MAQARSVRQLSWRITGGRLVAPAPFLVAGIVNITPDSFSDGGDSATPEAAMKRVRQVLDEGAAMVDLGAESTRPGANDIGQVEEWRRLRPVLEETLALRASFSLRSGVCDRSSPAVISSVAAPPARPEAFLPSSAHAAHVLYPVSAHEPGSASSVHPASHPPFAISIDTFRARTAALALASGRAHSDAGADIINDVSGGAFDPGMDEVLAEFKPGYVLGHSPARPSVMQQCPHYDNVVDEVLHWFSTRMAALVKAGLPEECICLDPCIGFGKNLEHNLALCAAVPRLLSLGRPLYFGVSRKSFLRALLELGGTTRGQAPLAAPSASDAHRQDMRRRDVASQAAIALLAQAGVAVHRVHQVAETMATLAIVRGFHPDFTDHSR